MLICLKDNLSMTYNGCLVYSVALNLGGGGGGSGGAMVLGRLPVPGRPT